MEIMRTINTHKMNIMNYRKQYIYTYSRIEIPVMINSSKSRA